MRDEKEKLAPSAQLLAPENSLSINSRPSSFIFQPSSLIPLLLKLVLIGLALWPVLNMVIIVSTTGANNISNDYLAYIDKIDRMLDGRYNWANYFKDTFVGGAHSFAFPFLLRLAIIFFTDWNIYVELWVGLILTAIKVILLHAAFTYLVRQRYGQIGWAGWLLWPGLAALSFSASQINTFTFGDPALQIPFNQLGVALGVWGLVRFEGRWTGIALMAGGGLMASWSGGSGLLGWPVFLIGMGLLNYRKLAFYAVWLGAAVLAGLPYLFFRLLQAPPAPAVATTDTAGKSALFSLEYLSRALGWPFAQKFSLSAAEWAGRVGLTLAVVGLVLLWTKRRSPALKQAAPALMIMAYGLLNVELIGAFRGALLQWYPSHFMVFWFGLLGLAYVLWQSVVSQPIADGSPQLIAGRSPLLQGSPQLIAGRSPLLQYSHPSALPMLWALATVGALLFLYLTTNITYGDKVFYLFSRSPVSASCLRNYQLAPTYCEQYIFQWEGGHFDYVAQLAQPLERHHLSVFGAQQEWTLQGNFGFENVRIERGPGQSAPFWTQDLSSNRVPWSNYRHLNLFLPQPGSVAWTVALPSNLKRAEFKSAVAISQSAQDAAASDGVRFEVYIERVGQLSQRLFERYLSPSQHDWEAFNLDLTSYAGQTITLRLASVGGSNLTGDAAIFRYPYIAVEVDTTKAVEGSVAGELPPGLSAPALHETDLRFDLSDNSSWKKTNLTAVAGESNTWKVAQNPMITSRKPLDLCLADYSHFYLRVAASSDIAPRSLQLYYLLDNATRFEQGNSVVLPLYADSATHEYYYPVRLLDLPPKTRLMGIRLDPVENGSSGGSSQVRLEDFRLIKGNQSSFCT